ncbi:MAG: hypothetical protein SVM86_02270 [Candidatus Cloacimonadota bacterium]|nr:hypothetical protein [Candidatus Cloacimonadota bacterium]
MCALATITLAELYEKQDQFMDALVIYLKLFKESPSEKLKQRIINLKKKIFEENEDEYSSTIKIIFSKEERMKFQILPHKQYLEYRKLMKQFEQNDKPDKENEQAEE